MNSSNQPRNLRYSIVVPIFQDGSQAHAFCVEFDSVFRQFLGVDDIARLVEVIFVNDGSTDDSEDELRSVCRTWPFAKAVSLSRNFGQHVALTCGYDYALGDFVGSINVDMQEPPSVLPDLLSRLSRGDVDIVIGCHSVRREPLFKRMSSIAFYYLLSKLTGYEMPLNMATVRVMNRRFVDAYRRLSEKSRFLPGLELWLGFRRGYVEIEHRPREVGKSSYNFRKRFIMALDSVISFSDVPLRMLVVAGGLTALVGFGLAFVLVTQKLFFTDLEAGYTSTMAAIVLLGGVQILVVGLTGLYVGRVLKEVQNRPVYVVRERINVDEATSAVQADENARARESR